MKTTDNIMAAFAGESQANRKYLAFAKKAESEGFPEVAKLFRAAAYAETVHAHNHLNVAKGVNSTVDNLKQAIEGESYEFSTMYPEFIKQAEADGNNEAKRSFELANEVEKIHEHLYNHAMKRVANGQDKEPSDIFVCEVCGNTVEGEAPGQCPICGARHDAFTKIE
ncbi:rubrerythrin [archaeon D22]|nr:rubrerythrin [archaeon D22]